VIILRDYTLLEDFIMKYRNQGIQIAIDDFGTGYSNFAHILKIRPNYIKIDGSLIKNINTDKSSYELVRSIIDFSKALNIKIIAEFVHSADVYDITVLELGVDEFQGFYLGEPGKNN
jgi:EAL domain-containing protein (putative c-di-GMP-specific phosphodiesterase class I)